MPNVTGTYDSDCVLDASAHLLSRDPVSQSSSVTICTLARVLTLIVLRVIIVFVVYCVDRTDGVSAWNILLVFSIIGVLKCGRKTSQARELACNKVFSYLNRSRLGGVVVSVLATGPKVCGLEPGQGDGFLRAIKIRSTPSFQMGNRAGGPTS
jgi:hypothetical protein